MGPVNVNKNSVITHFSHEHPLEIFNANMNNNSSAISCFGCNLTCTNLVYTCKTCNCFLHISCSQMPREITHPSHPNHVLILLSTPAYPEGAFNCNACGRQGSGFSYHCKACQVDLHILCASYPLSLSCQAHQCPLNLAFSPPYDNDGFSCDICKDFGWNQWLFRCDACKFDAHLGCAMAKPGPMVGADSANNSKIGSVVNSPNVGNQQKFNPMIDNGVSQTQTRSAIVNNSNAGNQHQINPMINNGVPQAQIGSGLANNSIPGNQPQIRPPITYTALQPPMGSGGYQQINSPISYGYSQVRPPAASNGMMGLMVQGATAGIAQEMGQTLIQSVVGGDSKDDSSSSIADSWIGSGIF